MRTELSKVKARSKSPILGQLGFARTPRHLGFDDGVIVPPEEFPVGTKFASIRNAAAERAPLRGTVRVIVVLVDFSDKTMGATTSHFQDLFFSTGVLPHGSVKEYYQEATGGLVDLTGQVIGPLRMPQKLSWYANGNFGIGKPTGTPRANVLAQDAAKAANPTVDFGPYDNDGNGYVDAFIVVHAGVGGEVTGDPGDIWSHKWTLPSAYSADGTKIYAYLTIPEDAKIGVSAHELGHLLFGFPDLYDTDYTSEGIGDWCLMAGGSWGGGGDIPTHPSAWCKVNQGWASTTNVTSSGTITIPDVKISRNVHRLWKGGASGSEYFLIENRQRTGFDQALPADGLLIWHIDEAQPGNTDENHYKVALVQADNKRDLELDQNRGDAGDPYPGTSGNTSFTSTSSPSSKSYAGQDTCVSITAISASGPSMTAKVAVTCGKALTKEVKDRKDSKDVRDGGGKSPIKEFKDARDGGGKSLIKELRDGGGKSAIKDFKDARDGGGKSPLKDAKDRVEGPGRGLGARPDAGEASGSGDAVLSALVELEGRVAVIEEVLHGAPQPFIGAELRPDLPGGPRYGAADSVEDRMASGDATAKREFDNLPSR